MTTITKRIPKSDSGLWVKISAIAPALLATVTLSSSPAHRQVPGRRRRRQQGRQRLSLMVLAGLGLLLVVWLPRSLPTPIWHKLQQNLWISHPQPLVMKGGDPYIRALMRTISAAESNTPQPYQVLYGGQSFQSLRQHPNICVEIVAGPHTGQCSTAAGRYQFLTQTWKEKASQYHPHPHAWYQLWQDYSFDAESQDWVMYQWLKDTSAWNLDISMALRQGQLEQVLRRLSSTWTSLGYGIESNTMTSRLPRLYQNLLQEELKNVSSSGLPSERG